MASATAAAVLAAVASETTSSLPEASTPAQGSLESAGQGISGGIRFFNYALGLALIFQDTMAIRSA
jgi:hypothetical protein